MQITLKKMFHWGLECAKRGIILSIPMFFVAMASFLSSYKPLTQKQPFPFQFDFLGFNFDIYNQTPIFGTN